MELNADKLLDASVTIVNRAGAKNLHTSQDMYFSHTLAPAFFSAKITRTVDSDGSVKNVLAYTAQVPSSTANFVSIEEFQANPGGDGYTVQNNDYLVYGTLDMASPCTLEELQEALKGKTFGKVNGFRDCRNNGATRHSNSGVLKYLDVVEITAA